MILLGYFRSNLWSFPHGRACVLIEWVRGTLPKTLITKLDSKNMSN